MRESIFSASLRAFFIALFSMMGILIGLLLVIMLFGGLSSTIEGEPEIKHSYSPEIVPNASGVRKSLSGNAPVILKLNIKGVIGLESLNRQTIEQQLIESQELSLKNERVKAILLYVDSPGGTVVDADAIYRLLKDYKEKYKLPIYAYIDGLCASGGMYVACAADKIYASDVSLIGSVGVILSPAMNFSQLMEKVGVQALTLYDGKGKDNLNPLRPWHEGEQDNIQAAINYYYSMFVDIVSNNRPNMSKEKLVQEYGANVYPPPLAKEYGYIDENGYTLDKTLKELANHIGIKDDYYQVLELKSSSWFSELFTSHFGLLRGEVTHRLELAPEMRPELQNRFLYLHK